MPKSIYLFLFLFFLLFSCEKSKFNRPDLTTCSPKDTQSCSEWASLEYLDGNAEKAKEYLELACKNNDAMSCYDLAMMLADEGQETRPNELIIKSCDLGNEDACEYVDDMNLVPGRPKKVKDDLEIPTQKKESENPNPIVDDDKDLEL